MRGRQPIREQRLRQGGWHVVNEHKEGDEHCLVLRSPHGRRNIRRNEDVGGHEIHVRARNRPLAYMEAERVLLEKDGRNVRPVFHPTGPSTRERGERQLTRARRRHVRER